MVWSHRTRWTPSCEVDKNLKTYSGLDITASRKKGSFIAGYEVNKIRFELEVNALLKKPACSNHCRMFELDKYVDDLLILCGRPAFVY